MTVVNAIRDPQIFRSQKKVQDDLIGLLDAMSRALPLLMDVDKFNTAGSLEEAMNRIKNTMVDALKFASTWQKSQLGARGRFPENINIEPG